MADPSVNLTGNASSLVNAIELATNAFVQFEATTARVQRDQTKFNAEGIAVSRTLVAIDAAGNKVVTTFKEIEGATRAVSTTVTSAATNIKQYAVSAEAAAAASALMAEAAGLNAVEQLRVATALQAESAEAFKTAAALEIQAAAHLETAASARNSWNAQQALDASTRKTAASAAALADAEVAQALATIQAAEAATVETRALELRNQAAATEVGGRLQTAASEARVAATQAVITAERTAFKERVANLKKLAVVEQKQIQDRAANNLRDLANKEAALDKEAQEVIAAAFNQIAAWNNAAVKRKAINEQAVLNLKVELAKEEQAVLASAEKQAAAFQGAAEKRHAEEEKVLLDLKVEQAKQEQAQIASAKKQAAAFQGNAEKRHAEEEKVLLDLKLELARQEQAQIASAKKQAAAFQGTAEKRHIEEEKILLDLKIEKSRQEQAQIASAKKQAAAFQENAQKRHATEEKILLDLKVELAKQEQAVIASAKKQAAAFQASQRQRANASAAQALPTRSGKTDFLTVGEGGKASQQAVQGFIAAEQAARRLVATGKIAGVEMSKALKQAQIGALKLGADLSVAERAALKVAAAENLVAAGANKAAVATNRLTKSIIGLGKLIGISLLIGAAFRLVQAFTDAATAAGELSIKLAEVETITQTNAFATEQWADGLRSLSSAFGIDTLKQAEAAYQVLSSQIKNTSDASIQGAEVIKFLGVANQLAVTGVTDTANATNLLTAAMNSFKIPAEEAQLVAARLFKSVELGRFRLEELAQGFGRVGVPAKQLGLELSDLLGIQAQITNQGVKVNEANTLIRGIFLKLIKPTKEMTQVFRNLGVANAESLFAARGTIGALQAIEAQTDGTTTEIGKLLSRVRAITGALSIFGENAKQTASFVKQIREQTIESFGKDTQQVINSAGQQLKIAGQEAANFFEKSIGTPAIQAIAAWIKEAGGMTKVIKNIIADLKTLSKVLVVTFAISRIAAIQAVTLSFFALGQSVGKAIVAVKALNVAFLANPALALAAGLSLVLSAFSEGALRASRTALQAAEDANLAIVKANEKRNTQIGTANALATAEFNRQIDSRIDGTIRFFTDVTALEFKNADRLAALAKQSNERFKILLKDFKTNVTEQLSIAKKEFTTFTKVAEAAAKLTQKILAGEGKAQFEIDVEAAGSGSQIKLIEEEIVTSRARVNDAVIAGDLKRFEIERKRLNDLVKQRIAAQIKVADESSKIQNQLEEARADRRSAESRQARAAADDRIRDLERQASVLKNGSAAQLKQERDLQKVRNQATAANDAEGFADALKELSKLKREQERINNLAIAERRIRAESAKEAATQAAQSEAIRKTNEARAEAARKEVQRVRSLQVVFNILAKDAEKFKTERVTEGKTAGEINKAVAEQQARFAKLITLGRAISKDRSGDLLFFKQDEILREQADSQTKILNAAANAKKLDDLKKELKAKLAIARQVSKTELGNLELIQKRIEEFTKSAGAGITDAFTSRGAKIRRAAGIGLDSGAGSAESQDEAAETNFSKLVEQGKELNQLILQQRGTFTQERQSEIDALVKSVLSNQLLDTGSLDSSSNQAGGQPAFNSIGQAQEDLNTALKTFRASVTRAGDSTLVFKKSADTVNSVLKGLEFAGEPESETEKVIKKELTAREEATEALKEALRIRKDLNKVLRGESVEEGSKTQTPVTPSKLDGITGGLGLTDKAEKETAEGLKKGINDAKGAAEKLFKDGASKGTKKGIKESEQAQRKAAETAGKEQAKAKNKEELDAAPELAAQIAKLEADIKRRQAVINAGKNLTPGARFSEPEFKRREVDTTIRLGVGAPSISSQQTRIQEELTKAAQEELKARKAQELQRKKDRALRGGRPGTFGGGPRAGTFTGGPRAGTFTGGPRPGATIGGEGPTQQKQLTAVEQTAANTKALVDAQKAKDAGISQSTLDAEATPLGLGVAAPTQQGTPASRIGSVLPQLLGQGQEEAAAELARATGRNADAQNRLLRAQEAATLIWEENNSAQNQFVNSIQVMESETDKMITLNRQRVPLAKAALDAEQAAFDNFIAAEDAVSKQAEPLKQFGDSSRSLLPRGSVDPVRVDPSGGLRAPTINDSSVTNVGGVQITVNESKDGLPSAKQLGDTLNRAIRSGAIKLSHNKSGPFTFASRKARGER
jgi:hypothetical protein